MVNKAKVESLSISGLPQSKHKTGCAFVTQQFYKQVANCNGKGWLSIKRGARESYVYQA